MLRNGCLGFAKCLQGEFQVIITQGGGHLGSDSRLAFGDHRE
jgi:hypothetical protein